MYLLSKFFREVSDDDLNKYFGTSDIDEIFKFHYILKIYICFDSIST